MSYTTWNHILDDTRDLAGTLACLMCLHCEFVGYFEEIIQYFILRVTYIT